MSARRVLVAGATGHVTSLILLPLAERYALTLVDVRTEVRHGHRVSDVEVLDLLDDPDDHLQRLCSDADTIVHGGFRPPTGRPSYAGGNESTSSSTLLHRD